MDAQTFVNIALGLIAFLGGWVVRNLQESMAQLRTADETLATKVQAIEVLVAGTYVKKSDMEHFTSAIFAKLDRIEDKLDGKVDK
jgi:hypothetical protein